LAFIGGLGIPYLVGQGLISPSFLPPKSRTAFSQIILSLFMATAFGKIGPKFSAWHKSCNQTNTAIF
jgi:hypothetical protein